MHKTEAKVFWRVSARCLMGAIVVGVLTFVCNRLNCNLSTAGFLYLIVVVLISATGSFFASAFVSIFAVGCLTYFFAPPAFSFRVVDSANIVAIAAFLTTSLVITRLISKNREMADEATLSVHRKLIDAEERERISIAKEIHDDINQRIALVAFNLEQLEQSPSKSPRHIRNLWESVSEIGADLHSISYAVHLSNVELLGIAASAQNFCREFAEKEKVEIDFKSRGVPSPVPVEISLALCRVLQEALRNSAKHSGERQFEVELFGTSAAIHLTVSDSGSGFDPEVAIQGKGLGLISMRERLKLVSGEFAIDSKARRGTKIRASVPLSSAS